MRISEDDWVLLSRIIHRGNPRISENSWLTNQTTDFCKKYVIPLLEHNQAQACATKKIMEFRLPELFYNELDKTNLAILEKFSEYKQIPVSHIIQRYIIDQRILVEEARMIKHR